MSATASERNAAFAARYPGFMAAVKRGEERQNEYMTLMETGTDEQIWAYEMRKEAAWLVDDMVCRLKRQLWEASAEYREFRQRMALRRAAEQMARAGRRYAKQHQTE